MDYNLCVTRSKRFLVRPSEDTPSLTLNLSPIDSLPVLRCNARTLHVFASRDAGPLHVPAPALVIRQALSKVLVPYYPLAGRLKQTNPNLLLQLDCSSQGVLFVEASSTSTLSSLHYFNDVSNIPVDQLLPDPYFPQTDTDTSSESLVQMQVTEFGCGGFVMGLIFCHSICDGLGAAQFLNAVGEVARGFERLSVTPVWHRDFFPPHPNTNATAFPMPKLPVSPLIIPDYTLQHSNFDISIERINEMKKEYYESTGRTCSAFEIVAASFWSRRTQAVYDRLKLEEEEEEEQQIKSSEDDKVKLVFFANCRQFVEPPLPKGFYGNCFFPVTINACSKMIAEASIQEVVKLIQEGKSKVGSEFRKYYKMKGSEEGEDPFAPPLKYSTLFISEWGRLGFKEVDYGWGTAVDVIPIQGSPIIPVGIVSSLPLPTKGIRLMTWCVEETHCPSFLNQMSKLLTHSIYPLSSPSTDHQLKLTE